MSFYDKLNGEQKTDFLLAKVDALEGEVDAIKEYSKGSLRINSIHRTVLGTAAFLIALSSIFSSWNDFKRQVAETERKDRLMWQLEKKYGNGESYHD